MVTGSANEWVWMGTLFPGPRVVWNGAAVMWRWVR